MLVERAAGPLLGPDVAIDRFVTDLESLMTAEPARHLLRAPIFAEQRLDLCPLRGGEVPIAPGLRAPAARVPVGELRAIGAVTACLIALDLTQHSAPMPSERTGDRGRAQAASPQHAERISFREGDLVIHHRYASFSWPRLKITVSQVTFFFRAPCCTYYMNARCLTRGWS